MERINDLFETLIQNLEIELGFKPLIHIQNIYYIPKSSEERKRLSNLVDFDSEIKDNSLYLIEQNESDLKLVLEYAGIKTFLNPTYLKIEGFMKIVFLGLFANRQNRPKVGKNIEEIIEYAAQLFNQSNGFFPDQIKSQIRIFFGIIDFHTLYQEFLISQAPHGQDVLYFLALQSYFISRYISTIGNNISTLFQAINQYKLAYDQSQLFPIIPDEIIPLLTQSPFHLIPSRLNLSWYLIYVQKIKFDSKLKKILQDIPFMFVYNLFDEQMLILNLLCQPENVQDVKQLLKELNKYEMIDRFQVIELGGIQTSFNSYNHIINFSKVKFDLNFEDIFILNRIRQAGIPVVKNYDELNKYLSYNIKNQLRNIRSQYSHLLKSNSGKFFYLNSSIGLISTALHKETNLDYYGRFLILTLYKVLDFDPIYLLIKMSNILSDIISISIQGDGLDNNLDLDNIAHIKYCLNNTEGKPVSIRYIIYKKKILQFYNILYQIPLNLITESFTVVPNFTEILQNYDFKNQKWNFSIPSFNEIPISKLNGHQFRKSAKRMALLDSIKKNSIRPVSREIIRFRDYFTEYDQLISNRSLYLQLLNQIFFLGQIDSPELASSNNLSKKIQFYSKRGDRLEEIGSPKSRYCIIFTSAEIDLNPVINYPFIQSLWKSMDRVVSISFYGGSWNGILIIDFSNREDLNLSYLSDLATTHILNFELYEILEENRWINAHYCYSREYAVRNFLYIMDCYDPINISIQNVDEKNSLYFPEYPLLYHVLGFNAMILLRFENISNEVQERIISLFHIFPIGKILKTTSDTLLIILHYDNNREFRRKLDQFCQFHKLTPKIDPILNLLEINWKHPFFAKSGKNSSKNE